MGTSRVGTVAEGEALEKQPTQRRAKGGSMEAGENQKVSTGSHTSLEISQTARDPHFSTAPMTIDADSKRNGKTKAARAA